jgi:hypothetical protein
MRRYSTSKVSKGCSARSSISLNVIQRVITTLPRAPSQLRSSEVRRHRESSRWVVALSELVYRFVCALRWLFCRSNIKVCVRVLASGARVTCHNAALLCGLSNATGVGRIGQSPGGSRGPSKVVISGAQLRAQSALVAPSDRGCLFQADAVRERIGMPMHELPFGPFTAIDLCDAQRPVLLL